jgi:catechol 2,3-dioxygenase
MSSPDPRASANDPLRGHPDSRLPSSRDVAALGRPRVGIDPRGDVGHVNLTVADLERSLRFYRDLLGLHVTQRDEQSAFLACGAYHHHVALNRWDATAIAPPRHSTGLHHFAMRLPDTTALADVVARLLDGDQQLLGATDHGVNLAVYLRDPDGNGVELMVDRPSAEWPRASDGSIAMRVDPFDLRALVLHALGAE